jgi:hypothetical protein
VRPPVGHNLARSHHIRQGEEVDGDDVRRVRRCRNGRYWRVADSQTVGAAGHRHGGRVPGGSCRTTGGAGRKKSCGCRAHRAAGMHPLVVCHYLQDAHGSRVWLAPLPHAPRAARPLAWLAASLGSLARSAPTRRSAH